MEQVEVGGLVVTYERAGKGPPLVLLHGLVGHALATWQDQIEELSEEFTVVAWDAPGSGRSSNPPPSFRMPEYAQCLAAFVDALELGRPHLVGMSFGAVLALEFYGRRPTTARTLILAGGSAGWAGSLGPDVAKERLRLCLHLAELPPQKFVAAMMPTMFSASAPPERVDAFAAGMLAFRPPGFVAMARALAEADLRHGLAQVEVPTLLLQGDQDARTPLDVAEALHAAIPTSQLVLIPGAGHVTSVEVPELFNRELLQFVHASDG
jgi:pimeloyl-ACP methyl ester carboxylesterase